MKKLISLFLFCVVGVTAIAQECSSYSNLSKNTRIEYGNYNSKNKLTSRTKNLVVDNKKTNDGFVITVSSVTLDDKSKVLASMESVGICNKGNYSSELKNFSSDKLPKSSDLKISFEGDKVYYPANLKPGDKLKDANSSINVTTSGGKTVFSVTSKMTNRKVEEWVMVETPAGKFQCLKITYQNMVSMKLMGTKKQRVSEYISSGVGVVKQEVFDEKNKLNSRMLMLKFTR